jgi:hypothetical protein
MIRGPIESNWPKSGRELRKPKHQSALKSKWKPKSPGRLPKFLTGGAGEIRMGAGAWIQTETLQSKPQSLSRNSNPQQGPKFRNARTPLPTRSRVQNYQHEFQISNAKTREGTRMQLVHNNIAVAQRKTRTRIQNSQR